jgi:putative flippase GtrA
MNVITVMPRKIITFAFGGLVGAVINWSITYGLTENFDVHYLISNLVGLTVNIIFNFFYHSHITFGVFDDTKRRFVKFVLFTLIIVALNIVIIFTLTEFFHIWYLFSAIIATFLIVIFNFVGNQFYIFRDTESK